MYGCKPRAVARSANSEGQVVLGGDNVPPLVEIGLTDLPKTGGGTCPPGPPTCDRPETNPYFTPTKPIIFLCDGLHDVCDCYVILLAVHRSVLKSFLAYVAIPLAFSREFCPNFGNLCIAAWKKDFQYWKRKLVKWLNLELLIMICVPYFFFFCKAKLIVAP